MDTERPDARVPAPDDWIGTVGKIAAFATPACIVAALVFDLTFWSVVDPDVFFLMTLVDHLSSAAVALPAAVAIFVGVFVLLGIVPPKSKVLGTQPRTEKFISRMRIVFLILAVVAIMLTFWSQSAFATVFLLLLAGSLLIYAAMLGFKLAGAFDDTKMVLSFGTLGMVLIALFGALIGVGVRSGRDQTYHAVRLDQGETINSAYALRSLSQGLFLIDGETHQAHTIPWGRVIEIVARPIP